MAKLNHKYYEKILPADMVCCIDMPIEPFSRGGGRTPPPQCRDDSALSMFWEKIKY